MKFERIETPGIAHYAYLISDGSVAALVDPSRDVEPYLQAARNMGCRITHILETHRQEDFVMGSAWLRQLTGACVVNGDHELFGRGDMRLQDGEMFVIGELRIQALHTPGHTPESMCYVLTCGEGQQPWGVFTGDTLFFGDTGRSDLPAEDESEKNAGLIHDAVHQKLKPLGDGTLVLPAHGPGSVCGSGMAERPWSTIGAEKQYNPVFQLDRDDFARRKGGERIPRPPYFRHMEKVNLEGGMPPVATAGRIPLLDVEAFARRRGETRLIDCREPEAFAGAHIPDSLNIWMGGLPVFGGWLADKDSPLLLLTDRPGDVDDAARHLTRIGIDNIQGALKEGFGTWRQSGQPLASAGTIMPRELNEQLDYFQVLDVREPDEYADGHIPDARCLYVGKLEAEYEQLDLDPERPVVVTCSVGHRAGVGVSVLRRKGFADVRNLIGGMSAWQALDLPIESGD